MATDNQTESEWLWVADIRISSRAVAVVDPMSWDHVDVELEPGEYAARIRTLQYGEESEPRVSRIQFLRKRRRGTIGEMIGEVGVDAATVGILDVNALDPELARQQTDYEETLNESWQSDKTSGVVKWGPGDDDEMVHVRSGFGDGTYPIRELLDAGARVGFEIQFIDPSDPQPF